MIIRLLLFLFCLNTYADINTSQLQEILDLDGTSSHIKGPNCWNGALYIAGLQQTKRFSHPDEWLKLLNENCLEVEKPERGDIGRIYYEADNTEVHGFIYLSRNSIFAKHGEDVAHGYQIMTTKEMLDQYGKTRACRAKNDESPECYHQIKYYRCNEKEQDSLLSFELLLEELIFSSKTIYQVGADCSNPNLLKRDELVKKMIDFLNHNDELITPLRLESYRHQLGNIRTSYRTGFSKCRDRKKRDQQIKKLQQIMRELSERN